MTSDDLPKLFGVGFDGPLPRHYEGQPVRYDPRVWLYRENPSGVLNAFNQTREGVRRDPRMS